MHGFPLTFLRRSNLAVFQHALNVPVRRQSLYMFRRTRGLILARRSIYSGMSSDPGAFPGFRAAVTTSSSTTVNSGINFFRQSMGGPPVTRWLENRQQLSCLSFFCPCALVAHEYLVSGLLVCNPFPRDRGPPRRTSNSRNASYYPLSSLSTIRILGLNTGAYELNL